MPVPRAVSMSIALTDHHPFNGGLMMMPGSHRTFVPCAGRTPLEHYRSPLIDHEIGVPSTEHLTSLASAYGIEQFTAPAGSALMFDANLMHGSGNNITPFPRSNIFLVFNSVENALVEPFGGTPPRPDPRGGPRLHPADPLASRYGKRPARAIRAGRSSTGPHAHPETVGPRE